MTTAFRKLALGAFLSVSALGTLTMTSCKKDDPKVCNSGYYGTNCDSTFADKYLGTYSVSETKDGAANPPSFSCAITRATAEPAKSIVISNFGNSGVAITATVDNAGNITVPITNITATKTTSGTGILNGKNITLTYTISGSATIYVDAMTRL
jgi:hypothetical protein